MDNLQSPPGSTPLNRKVYWDIYWKCIIPKNFDNRLDLYQKICFDQSWYVGLNIFKTAFMSYLLKEFEYE